jgi:hypothetical protein
MEICLMMEAEQASHLQSKWICGSMYKSITQMPPAQKTGHILFYRFLLCTVCPITGMSPA